MRGWVVYFNDLDAPAQLPAIALTSKAEKELTYTQEVSLSSIAWYGLVFRESIIVDLVICSNWSPLFLTQKSRSLIHAQEMYTSAPPLELAPSPFGLGQMLLIMSGDVELNPGPENSEYRH